jgi:hypothetical protein
MTKDDIILMSDASGLSWYGMGKDREKFIYYLKAFAALVAAAEPWQGLTWEDMPEEYAGDSNFLSGARWAEARLKEKNNG